MAAIHLVFLQCHQHLESLPQSLASEGKWAQKVECASCEEGRTVILQGTHPIPAAIAASDPLQICSLSHGDSLRGNLNCEQTWKGGGG